MISGFKRGVYNSLGDKRRERLFLIVKLWDGFLEEVVLELDLVGFGYVGKGLRFFFYSFVIVVLKVVLEF